MSQYCTLSRVQFGKLDANSEYLLLGKDAYKAFFYACPGFNIDGFLNGDCYYIHGEKGSGKTALLKYIEIIAEENQHRVDYIRFKKDIDEDERNAIKRAGIPAEPFETIVESEIPSDFTINCVAAWQVFMIRSVLDLLREDTAIFENTPTLKKLRLLLDTAYGVQRSTIKRIVPAMKRGNIKLDVGVAELNAEFEWSGKDGDMVSFRAFAKKVQELFEGLKVVQGCSKKCYILFDELELIYLKKKTYERDVALIRDLIQAIAYLNESTRTLGFPIHIIACIRNEVYRSAAANGFELNKLMQDFGVEISWHQNGGNIQDHPLIQMLENRLVSSQSQDIQDDVQQTGSILRAYFPDNVDIDYPRQTALNYIIDQTWGKPRDIVRLFNLIKSRYGERTQIKKALFESVRKQYSTESWEEFSNELTAKYSQTEVEAIRQVLVGGSAEFSLIQFCERIEEKAKFFPEVKALSEKHVPATILQDLYRIGVIGTNSKWKRFYFKGDPDFDPTAECVIHYPLRRFFSVN